MQNIRPAQRAFTLIELLVVIAIIAILAAILFPVFAQAKEAAKKTACLSNTKQIGISLQLYLNDVDDTYPGALQTIDGPRTRGGNRIPIDLQLEPYVKSLQIWACPSDSKARPAVTDPGLQWWDTDYITKNAKRSYAYLAEIRTLEGDARVSGGCTDENTGVSTYNPCSGRPGRTGKNASSLDQPSSTVVLTENYPEGGDNFTAGYVGSPHGAALTGCDIWKLAGRDATQNVGADSMPSGCYTTNKPTKGHSGGGNRGGSNYVNADTSAKFRTWTQVRANDFYMFKLQKPTTTVTP